LDDGIYMTAQNYTFYVTGDSTTEEGKFACQIKAPSWGGSNADSTLLYLPVDSAQSSACASGSTPVKSIAFTFTHSDPTGLYDVSVYFSNITYPSSSFYAGAILYRGSNPITGSNDPCGFASVTVAAARFTYFAVPIQNVTLTQGQNYTVVASGGDVDALAWWGATVDPTIVGTTTSSAASWTQPTRSFSSGCTPDTSYDNSRFFVYTFIAQGQTYILDTQQLQWSSDNLDTYSFLYSGLNNATVPDSCSGLLFGGDTGDQTPVAYQGLVVGQPYTIIVSCYFSDSEGDFGLYAFTGTQLGVIPTTGPAGTTAAGGATTAAPTGVATASGTTAAPTGSATSAAGTSAASASTAASSTTAAESGAMQLGVSALLLLVAAFLSL